MLGTNTLFGVKPKPHKVSNHKELLRSSFANTVSDGQERSHPSVALTPPARLLTIKRNQGRRTHLSPRSTQNEKAEKESSQRAKDRALQEITIVSLFSVYFFVMLQTQDKCWPERSCLYSNVTAFPSW